MAKYKISKRIGRGGMAEVFLAVQEGVGGFEKLVVVKRIFPQFSSDAHFVDMFLREARLAASIRHPNVVHINDIEQDENGYFLVMEYLSGESLAYIWEALRTHRKIMPPNIVCRIGASIAAGLHHAHIATDAAGHPQPIVHRDVTPSNLIVCYTGVVKIVDFGVAKATLTEGQTRGGALKGKMSYLSPEQIEDEPIDGRTDVFQLGICLHEMLTGRRLFRGKTDHDKLRSVMEKDIAAPSQFNPRVPRILDEVVLKALARDRQERHQSAEALRRELDNALGELGSVVSDSDVGVWMRETLPERLVERKDLERTCVSEIREGRPLGVTSSGGGVLFSEGPGGVVPQRTPTLATVLERRSQSATQAQPQGRWPRRWMVLGGAAVVALVSVAAWQLGSESASSGAARALAQSDDQLDPVQLPPATLIHVTATPEAAKIFIDDQRIGIGYGERRMVISGKHRLRVMAPGFETFEEEFDATGWPKVVRLQPAAETSRSGGDGDGRSKAKKRASISASAAPLSRASTKSKTRARSVSGPNKDATAAKGKAAKGKAAKGKAAKGKDARGKDAKGKADEKKSVKDQDGKDKDDFFRKTDNIDPFEE